MASVRYRPPKSRSERMTSILLGGAFAGALFVVIALAQMMGDVRQPTNEIDETVMAFVPPESEKLEEEQLSQVEDEAPPPELDFEPPTLSLDQLDIALNPGTGASLAGDFAMPTISTSSSDLGTEDFVDFSDLDQIPRPIGVSGFNFPRRLRQQKVNGQIVLLLRLDENGQVLEAEIDDSDLPRFESFVLNEVKGWRFTPPTQDGRPVKAKARLPIPIRIS